VAKELHMGPSDVLPPPSYSPAEPDQRPSPHRHLSASELFPAVYERLHKLAAAYLRRERPDHTLQPTAVVHEVYLKLAGQGRARWRNAEHFYLVAAEAARRVLIDHARGRMAAKRGGGHQRVGPGRMAEVPDDRAWTELIALDDALDRLSVLDERLGRVAVLNVYAGMSHEQVALTLGVGRTTAATEWAAARAWLTREMKGDGHAGN
jgi:RNA polymerase sigma-70 factor (ECF subfamily)